jgi:hypothetical protein
MHKTIVVCLIFSAIFSSVFGQHDTSIKLDYFKEVPAEVDGCNGSFTYDSISLKQEKFIVVIDLQKLAFIRVNGIIVRLTLSESKHLSEKKSKDIYKGGGYTLVLITTEGKRVSDELYLSSGTMEISTGNQKLHLKIHGEGGC